MAGLLALQLTGVPGVMAAAPSDTATVQPAPPPDKEAAPPAPPARVTPNRTLPRAVPAPLLPTFSKPPLDAEIYRARVFDEPFVPAAGARDAREDSALSAAILEHIQSGSPSDLTRFEAFLRAHPQSRWAGALLLDMGIVYRRTGYFTRAIDSWERAWTLLKGESEPRARALADRAVGELAELNARLGRYEQLEALFAEIATRDVRGPASQKLAGAREGFAVMQKEPERAFLCGPFGIDRILARVRQGYVRDPKIDAAQSTHRGTSMAQMLELAASVGLKMQLARRTPGAEVIKPALVHWKAGHFAALVEDKDGRLLLQDPTFGDDLWITRAALDDQASGFFLVPEGKLPAGWEPLPASAGETVWGKGITNESDNQAQGPKEPSKPDCCEDGACPPMAVYKVNLMLVNLHVSDTPVRYQPPLGPAMRFALAYNQREIFQPQLPMFSNLGPKWTFDWFSFAEDDPANGSANVNVYLRRGGQETYTNMWTGTSFPHSRSRAQLVRTSSTRYERRLPDGSIEVFGQPDGSLVAPRRLYLTQVIDAQGNHADFTYSYEPTSGGLRLVSATDAIGQVTSFAYEDADPLKITKVTDPFGRFATFEYEGAGRLSRITDVIGLTSDFTYGPNDFISSLTTPYGTTSFATGQTGNDRWLETTDPLGAKERFEYLSVAPMPGSESVVPAGMATFNMFIHARNTFYWDKRATVAAASGGSPYSKAHIYHWLHMAANTGTTSAVLESEKLPLESRVWFNYPGQWAPGYEGTAASPSIVGRVLDDGTTQLYRYEYGPRGNACKKTDPAGRETRYTYGTEGTPDADCATGTGIDLLKFEQKNDGTYDLISSSTYNTQHRILTSTDASGQTTTYTYNADGQIATITTPARAGITENRTTTYTYDTNGYLHNVAGPFAGAPTAFTYDGYGRVRTTTDVDGYSTTTDYDALNRPTRVTYPDGTFDETVYFRLDPHERRDRLGRTTHIFYDALRRPVALRDPLGRTTTQQWCTCGSLDQIVDAAGRATTWERDLQSRLTKESRADGTSTSYVYDNTTSRIHSITDEKLQTKTYTYALDGDVTAVNYTNAQVATPNVSITYDPFYRRLAMMTDGTGTRTYTYNPVTIPPTVGALLLASADGPFASDTVTYTYDELGRVVGRQVNGSANTMASTYDALGRKETESNLLGTFQYAYDGGTKRISTLTYPNGQTSTYSYFGNTGDHRLQEIWHKRTDSSTLSKFDYTYDLVGNVKTWSQQQNSGPAKVFTLGYDLDDELTTASISGVTPPPVPSRFAYAYDKAGNRIADQQDDGVIGATYNVRNQLVSQQPGGALLFRGTVSEPATVNAAGVAAQVTVDNQFAASVPVPSGTTNVSITATDPSGNVRTNTYQLTQSGSTKSFTHDTAGNLTNDGTRTFEWDAENRLIRVLSGASELVRFGYDGEGRRVQKIAGGVTHSYIYDDGMHVAEERLSTGGTIRYFHGPATDDWLARQEADGSATYFVADHLGSIVQQTNAAGQVTLARSYDLWGNLDPTSAAASGPAFTGRDWDAEISLGHYRARYYDGRMGNFVSEDPVDFGDGKSRYAYVQNNPVRLVDPSGYVAGGCGGKNCDPNAAPCGGPCPHWVFTEYQNLCQQASNNPDVWIRNCLQKKCKGDLKITCNSSDCTPGGTPAYTPCSDSVVVCPNNPIPVPDPKNPPCWKRVIAHEIVVHACRPHGPQVPNHNPFDPDSTRVRNGITCP